MGNKPNEWEEEKERGRKRLEEYSNMPGFESVPVILTGVGNVVDYLSRQNPEDGACMEIQEANEDGNLQPKCFGYPTIQGVLDLIVEAYEESEVAAFVGFSDSGRNKHPGMYFRLIFGPQNSDSHLAREELWNGQGATKAYEIVCSQGEFTRYKPRIAVKQTASTTYEGAK